MFALNRRADLAELLVVNQPCHVVPLGETLHEFFPVLVDTPDKIVRYPNIERAADPLARIYT